MRAPTQFPSGGLHAGEDPSREEGRDFVRRSVALIEADQRRSADTHLLRLGTRLEGIDLYLKDESTHPTGSLKHRLARSLFLYGLCNRRIRAGRPVVEASSGSTAVSEAYFARMIGVPFYAVMPRNTSCDKIAAIEHYGGICHLVENPGTLYAEASALAEKLEGYYLDQFTYAERATDWRGNNNIAESIFDQMRLEASPEPAWIVMSAGTGGTTATIGRYISYKRLDTRLLVVDPEFSAFFEGYRDNRPDALCARSSRIEGIGRPRVEPSFLPDVVDEMIRIPDAASLGAMRVLARLLGRKVGGSTGTNFFALCWKASRMREQEQTGSLVSLICDSGDRYSATYYCQDWLEKEVPDAQKFEAIIERFLDGGAFDYQPPIARGAI